MNGQLNSLESFDSGSNYRFGDKMIKSAHPRSLFDLSHLNTLTIPNCGMLVPISVFETLPGDDHDINVDCLLRVLPQVVPLYSRQRLYIYAFYSRYSDLWNNWQVFMDKGYTGTVDKSIPYLLKNTNLKYSSEETLQPDTLFDYMGLPQGMSFDNSTQSSIVGKCAYISALPFMMYLRIYRDYFMNRNHWINDRVMLPDDDSRFRLDDDGQLLSAKDQSAHFYFATTSFNSGKYDLVVDGTNYYMSGCMHDYPDDYFVSALPFPQRGDPSALPYSIDPVKLAQSLKVSFSDCFKLQEPGWTSANTFVTGFYAETTAGTTNYNLGAGSVANTGTLTVNKNASDGLKTILNRAYVTSNSNDNIGLNISLNDIRKLAIEQQELEQLARTDGSYFQFGLSFFGEPSKAAYDFRPIYIGGTYKNIAFTEVLQTATTQTTVSEETVTNPTGAYAGHGITGISSGRIGHIHCDDYGMIMILACIMPDVYYSQGLSRLFTDRKQIEKFLPERSLLGMQPILNKEIYYAGNNGDSEGNDNYLWAYQNPYDWLRYIANGIHGKIADPNSESFYPYTQARHFTQLPNWGREFSSTNDVRKSYLVAPSEDAYSAQFSINIRSVRPLPYKAVPAKLVHF